MKSTMHPTARYAGKKGEAAFNLIELLITIGILSVLIAIGSTAIKSAMKRADDVRCIANLRQVGVGMAAYCGENSGTLPGPLLPSQGPRYNRVADGPYTAYLANYLFPYLDIPAPQPGALPSLQDARRIAPMFFCPAFAKASKNNFANSYFMRWKISGLGNMSPWGSYGTSIPQYPIRLTSIPKPMNTWAMSDIDVKSPDLPAVSWSSSLPEAPIHGNRRNALFFDWHVAKIAADGEVL